MLDSEREFSAALLGIVLLAAIIATVYFMDSGDEAGNGGGGFIRTGPTSDIMKNAGLP